MTALLKNQLIGGLVFGFCPDLFNLHVTFEAKFMRALKQATVITLLAIDYNIW